MVTNAVESFGAQVERNQRDVGAPHCMVETFRNEGAECVFAGMTTRAVATVVTECDSFGERNVESECTRYCGRNLGDFECMREPRALVVLREHEHLGFASKSAKCGSVQNAIAIAFEACAEWVFLFGACTIAGTE